ncbi:MAG: hypothetical protein JSV25_08800, partial [Spirochaetota bacterium]
MSKSKKKSVISIITIIILMILALVYLFSCTAGVDIGGANRVLTSFSITWPSGFNYNCLSAAPVIITINAIDQFGKVFDSWSGVVSINSTNVFVSITPPTVNVTRGAKEVAIVFESLTEDIQQVQIELSYEDFVVEIEDVILVGLIAPMGVMATDGFAEDYIFINWDEMEYAEKYDVYRSESELGPYSKLADTSSIRYQDTNCAGGTTYYYKIRA